MSLYNPNLEKDIENAAIELETTARVLAVVMKIRMKLGDHSKWGKAIEEALSKNPEPSIEEVRQSVLEVTRNFLSANITDKYLDALNEAKELEDMFDAQANQPRESNTSRDENN